MDVLWCPQSWEKQSRMKAVHPFVFVNEGPQVHDDKNPMVESDKSSQINSKMSFDNWIVPKLGFDISLKNWTFRQSSYKLCYRRIKRLIKTEKQEQVWLFKPMFVVFYFVFDHIPPIAKRSKLLMLKNKNQARKTIVFRTLAENRGYPTTIGYHWTRNSTWDRRTQRWFWRTKASSPTGNWAKDWRTNSLSHVHLPRSKGDHWIFEGE